MGPLEAGGITFANDETAAGAGGPGAATRVRKETGKENSSAADGGEDGGRARVKLVTEGDGTTDGG